MPLLKRTVFDADVYSQAYNEFCDDSSNKNILVDKNMSKYLGVLLQISYLSAYSVEMFDTLARSADDMNDRIQSLSSKTTNLFKKLPDVEKKIKTTGIDSNDMKISFPLKNRAGYIPTVLTKKSNAVPIRDFYMHCCNLPPPLWKIESIMSNSTLQFQFPSHSHDQSVTNGTMANHKWECLTLYSDPGYFFSEWLRVEMLRQMRLKEERKRLKRDKKLNKKKRKEAALATLTATETMTVTASDTEVINTDPTQTDTFANSQINEAIAEGNDVGIVDAGGPQQDVAFDGGVLSETSGDNRKHGDAEPDAVHTADTDNPAQVTSQAHPQSTRRISFVEGDVHGMSSDGNGKPSNAGTNKQSHGKKAGVMTASEYFKKKALAQQRQVSRRHSTQLQNKIENNEEEGDVTDTTELIVAMAEDRKASISYPSAEIAVELTDPDHNASVQESAVLRHSYDDVDDEESLPPIPDEELTIPDEPEEDVLSEPDSEPGFDLDLDDPPPSDSDGDMDEPPPMPEPESIGVENSLNISQAKNALSSLFGGAESVPPVNENTVPPQPYSNAGNLFNANANGISPPAEDDNHPSTDGNDFLSQLRKGKTLKKTVTNPISDQFNTTDSHASVTTTTSLFGHADTNEHAETYEPPVRRTSVKGSLMSEIRGGLSNLKKVDKLELEKQQFDQKKIKAEQVRMIFFFFFL